MTPLYIDETDDEITLYYEHPRNFIPPSVLEWYEEYAYYKEFSVAPDFRDCNLRFLDAKTLYDQFTNYWNTPRVNNEGYS